MAAPSMIEMMNGYNAFPSALVAANEDIFNGNPASDVISMESYEEIVFFILKNAGGSGTATITVESCDNVTPTTPTAVAFKYKASTSGNTWGATTAVTSSTASPQRCGCCRRSSQPWRAGFRS